jgi:hypothetical protein
VLMLSSHWCDNIGSIPGTNRSLDPVPPMPSSLVLCDGYQTCFLHDCCDNRTASHSINKIFRVSNIEERVGKVE